MPPHVYAVSDNAYNDMLRFVPTYVTWPIKYGSYIIWVALILFSSYFDNSEIEKISPC